MSEDLPSALRLFSAVHKFQKAAVKARQVALRVWTRLRPFTIIHKRVVNRIVNKPGARRCEQRTG
jgi:hypothetical protein